MITRAHAEEDAKRMKWHGEPSMLARWMHVVNDHDGRLPISIRAVPEGSLIPVGNALRIIRPTCPKCGHATSVVLLAGAPNIGLAKPNSTTSMIFC